MNALGIAVVWCALQTTLFLSAASIVYLAARRSGPRTGAMVAGVSLAASIGIGLLAPLPWPSWESVPMSGRLAALREPGKGRPIALQTRDAEGADVGVAETSSDALSREAAGASSEFVDWQASWRALTQALSSPARPSADHAALLWPTIVGVVFLVGAALAVAYLALGSWLLRALLRRSQPIADAPLLTLVTDLQRQLGLTQDAIVRESAELTTPAVIGVRRPTVLLPANWRQWRPAERMAILAHELAHAAHRDFLATLVARVAAALHYYHPLAHWFAARLTLEQELAADRRAARIVGDRTAYLHALASIALASSPQKLWGPIQTFVPKQSLLLRRVDMLRRDRIGRNEPTTLSFCVRAGALGLVLSAGLAVVGVRPRGALAAPDNAAEQAGASKTAADSPDKPQATTPGDVNALAEAKAYDFSYVPERFVMVIAIRPKALIASPRWREIAELFQQSTRPKFDFHALHQVTLCMPVPDLDPQGRMAEGSGGEFTIFRTDGSIDFRAPVLASYGNLADEQIAGKSIWAPTGDTGSIAFYSPNRHTLLSRPEPALKAMVNMNVPLRPAGALEKIVGDYTGPLLAVADISSYRTAFGGNAAGEQLPGTELPAIAPLLKLVDRIAVRLDDGDDLQLTGTIMCSNPESAPAVVEAARSAILLAQNLAALRKFAVQSTPVEPGTDDQKYSQVWKWLAENLGRASVAPVDGNVIVSLPLGRADEVVPALLAPLVRSARDAALAGGAQQAAAGLATAMQSYAAANDNQFPPAVFYTRRSDGVEVPRSWRVELLPHLGLSQLYAQYRHDEPWDSPANRRVLAQMPAFYRCPADDPGSTNASFFVVSGPGTVFEGRKGTPISKIFDGISNTILFVEAKREIPWTKPEDISYRPDQPLDGIGGWRQGQAIVAMCDGSAVPLSTRLGDDVWRALIERADGAVVTLPQSTLDPEANPNTN